MYKRVEAIECVCDICGHKWIAGAIPKRCARCKSRIWNCDGEKPAEPEPVVKVSRSSGVAVPKIEKPEKPKAAPEMPAKSSGCPGCGSMSGHQRWCPNKAK
jgi:hypothetical protein